MHLSSTFQTVAVLVALTGVGVYRAQGTTRPSQQIKVSKAGTQPTYFVEHPDNIQPGLNLQSQLASLKNPYSGNPARIAEGGKLFVSYNCMDCHGADGAGAMGPSLQDGRMHFGSTVRRHLSIHLRRPAGRDAVVGRHELPTTRSGGSSPMSKRCRRGTRVSTENFTGKTIDRGGR